MLDLNSTLELSLIFSSSEGAERSLMRLKLSSAFLPKSMYQKNECCWAELSCFSCLTFCEPMDCSPPGSSVHGIL